MQSIIPTLESGLVSWLTPDSWNMVEVTYCCFQPWASEKPFGPLFFFFGTLPSHKNKSELAFWRMWNRDMYPSQASQPSVNLPVITRPWRFKPEEISGSAQPKLMAIQNGELSKWFLFSATKFEWFIMQQKLIDTNINNQNKVYKILTVN